MEFGTEIYCRRISRLYDAWFHFGAPTEEQPLSNVSCFVVAVGDLNTGYNKSVAFFNWLFGRKLVDTVCIFTRFNLHILTSDTEAEQFLPIVEHVPNGGSEPFVRLFIHDPNDADSNVFTMLLDTIAYKAITQRGNRVGVFTADEIHGEFCESWQAAMNEYEFKTMNVTTSIDFILATKEECELVIMHESCNVSVEILEKFLESNIREIITANTKIKHSEVAAGMEKTLTEREFECDVDPKHLTMCYPPIIQSGGHYQLNYNAGSNDEYLDFETIVCSFGICYKSYCSHIGRTLLHNPPLIVQKNYDYLQELERKLFKMLIPGARLNEIYASIVGNVRAERPDLVDHLLKTFGCCIGIEFNGSSLIIGPQCKVIVKPSMIFNVSIGFEGLRDEMGKPYALFYSDTAIVNECGPAMVLTPPPYVRLIYDCWTHVFDYLSIQDMQAMSKTGKYMRQMVNEYFRHTNRRYVERIVRNAQQPQPQPIFNFINHHSINIID